MNKQLDSQDFYYLLRLLRLYVTGVFRSVDKNFHPKITIMVFTLGTVHDFFNIALFPNYSEYENTFLLEKNTLRQLLASSIDREEEQLKDHYFKEYLERILSDFDNSKKYLISNLVVKNDIVFGVCTEFERSTFEQYNKLTKGFTSFVDALATEYNKDVYRFLNQYMHNDADKPVEYTRTIRFAGEWFTTIVGSQHKDHIYDKLNVISSLPYEGQEGHGKILFTDEKYLNGTEEHPDIYYAIKFAVKVPIALYRAIRKLLEISNGKNYLLSDAKYIYGLGHLKQSYDSKREDIFLVKFLKHYTWQLYHGDEKLMFVSHENPSIALERIPKKDFSQELMETFPGINTRDSDRLYGIVRQVIKQKKGALLVISDHAIEEAERLKNQCLLIQPTPITPEQVEALSSIDGALLINPEGIAYAAGVILDGYASEYGTVTRGARYNSSIRYIETMAIKNTNPHNCIAVVISEDGMIDVISKRFFNKRNRGD